MEFNDKIHLVDFAGSESAKFAAGHGSAEVTREHERININRSLLTLGRGISIIKEQSEMSKKTNVRIPYRDSKLTRILQEGLGGRCKTVIVATLSLPVSAIKESIYILNYTQVANSIINKPIAASKLSLKLVANPYMTLKGDSLNGEDISNNENYNSPNDWNDFET